MIRANFFPSPCFPEKNMVSWIRKPHAILVIPLVVPVTCSDHDRTGLILESMAYAGKVNVEPAYIEVAMKIRCAADPDTAEMLEMIFNNRLVSAGYFYSNLDTISTAHDVFWMKGNAQPEIASWYKSQEKMENKRVEKINKFFADGE